MPTFVSKGNRLIQFPRRMGVRGFGRGPGTRAAREPQGQLLAELFGRVLVWHKAGVQLCVSGA